MPISQPLGQNLRNYGRFAFSVEGNNFLLVFSLFEQRVRYGHSINLQYFPLTLPIEKCTSSGGIVNGLHASFICPKDWGNKFPERFDNFDEKPDTLLHTSLDLATPLLGMLTQPAVDRAASFAELQLRIYWHGELIKACLS